MMKRFMSWLLTALLLLPAGGAIPAAEAEEEKKGYWELDSMEFMLDPWGIQGDYSYGLVSESYSMSDGHASINLIYSYTIEWPIDSEYQYVELIERFDVTFKFNVPQTLIPGETFYVPIEIIDNSTKSLGDGHDDIRNDRFTVLASLVDDDEYRDDYWDNGFSYYPIMNPETQGNISMKVASPYGGTAYLDIYVIAEADRGKELFGRYRYVYVDEQPPEFLRLRGIVSSMEGKPMTWMAMRAGVCEDYTAGQAAFAAGQYEDAAAWVTGKTDTRGVYTLEAPLSEDAKGTVGVILEGTLLCKWPGAGDRTAFFLTDDSDGLANGTPMRVATFLTVDLDRSRAAARDGGPPTNHHHLNFQTLLTSGGWSNNYTGPDPVSLHPSGSTPITVRDNFANTVTLYDLSGEQRLAEASVTYQSAVAASFFGAAVLDEEVMCGANLPIHLRSKGAEAAISSYFNGDPGNPSVHIEARDSRNDDDGRFAVLHEMGHAFDFITNGNAYRTLQGEMPGDRNHGGYMNGSTADSYTEGFATAFAAWTQLYGAYSNPEVVSVWSLDIPYRYRAWGREGRDEELAIAAFLYQTFFHMRDMKVYWSILKPPLDNFAEYYDALVDSPLNPDSGKTRRDAITLGLFKMPYAGNGKYDQGEPYIDANNSGGWDAAEPFEDKNTNGVYDPGEEYDDSNRNGSWDAGEPFDDKNGNGVYDPGEPFTDSNNNNVHDDEEPYADLIFGDGTFDLAAEYPIRPYDEAALVAGEAGDFNRAGRRTPPKLPNGFLRLEGEGVDSVLVTVLPEGGEAIRSLRAVGGSSVFLLVPDMYAAGRVQVDIPGGGRIYEGSIAELNEVARSLAPGEPLAVAQVKPGDLAPEGTVAVATYGDASATGVMELVDYGEEELSSLAQTYEEQPALTDFEFDWSAIPEAPGAADETPVPTQAAVAETPVPTQAVADETSAPTQAAAAETPLPALTFPSFPDFGTEGIEDGAVLWTNANADALQKGAQTYYVVFELERDSTVSSITTDHSLSGGAEPGQISLFSESGAQWGPFQAVGKAGQNGAKNALWVADTGDLALPAGRYAVTDSDPSSWSSNAASDNLGIAEVRGSAPAPAPTAQANPFGELVTPQPEKPAAQASFVGLWLSERMESGESLLLNVLSEDALEQCYAYYMGDGYGGVESLTDANWNCLEFLTCSYELSGDTLLIRTERGMDFAYDFRMRDADTAVLTDEWGATFVMHRASQEQAVSWRSWDWSGENAYDDDYGQYSNWMGGVSPEETLPGLWLSEPLGDGWQMLIYFIPDFGAEVYFGLYSGDGGSGVESLADPSWNFDESALYNYYVVSEEITFYEGYDSSSTFWFSMPDPDTIELVSGNGNAYYLHRATLGQENSWLGWMRNRAGD